MHPIRKLRQWARGDAPVDLEGLTAEESKRIAETHDEHKTSAPHRQRRFGLGLAGLGLLSSIAAFQHYSLSPQNRHLVIETSFNRAIDDTIASAIGADSFNSNWARAQYQSAKNIHLTTRGIPALDDVYPDIPLPPSLTDAQHEGSTWGEYQLRISQWRQALDQWARDHTSSGAAFPPLITDYGILGDDAVRTGHVVRIHRSSLVSDSDEYLFYDGQLIETTLRYAEIPVTSVCFIPTILDKKLFLLYSVASTVDQSPRVLYVREFPAQRGYGPFFLDRENPGEERLAPDDPLAIKSYGAPVGSVGFNSLSGEESIYIHTTRGAWRIPLATSE